MYLCLDYGDRYIGVAGTDTDGTLPHRLGVIDQKLEDWQPKTRDMIRNNQTKKILVGLPIGLSGQETDQTRKTKDFVDQLRRSFGNEVEIATVDETLTSVEARRRLETEAGRPEDEHAEAARIMLEEYLAGQRKQP